MRSPDPAEKYGRRLIMEYKVIEANDTAGLQQEVNREIQAGWVPQGGVAVAQSEITSTWWYYQAMVKRTGATEDRLGE
jgi:hypothetical protein